MRLAFSKWCSGPDAGLGWLLLFVGVFAWCIFGRNADWTSITFYWSQLERTNGVVNSISATGFTSGSDIDGDSIYEVRFTFDGPNSRQYQGTSWTDQTPKRGEKIRVEYVVSGPETSRIVNMRSGILPLWAGAVLVFPTLGVYYMIRAFVGNQTKRSFNPPKHG